MIKANDLRIGNIVFVDNEKHHPLLKDVPLEVTGISETTLDGEWTYSISLKHINQQPNKYYESYSQFIKFIKPIPLTPEVLEKAGFVGQRITVNLGVGGYHPQIIFYIPDGFDEFRGGTVKQPKHKHDFIISCFLGKKINDLDYECGFHYQINQRKKGTELKSLHQLQNLYHAITQEELTLNLCTATNQNDTH